MQDTKKYFDWAASTPPDTCLIQKALLESFDFFANPSSLHSCGKAAFQRLSKARADCAKVLGCLPQTLYFCSGGTEADQIPLLSLLEKQNRGSIIISDIEHPAVKNQAMVLKKHGFEVIFARPNKEGIVEPCDILQKLKKDTLLVAVMLVNNETGAVQPIKQISTLLEDQYKNARKPLLHIDCVQALGKIPFDFLSLGADSAAFCAHKIMGPRGIGLLYCKKQLNSFLKGGGQEGGLRSGTQNLFGAVCLSYVMQKYAITKQNPLAFEQYKKQRQNTQFFIRGLLELKKNNKPICKIVPQARGTQNSSVDYNDNYSPYIVQASFERIPGQVMLRALDEKGFCISTGSACSSSKNSRPVLQAMGVPPDVLQNAVRFSFGYTTTQDDIKDLLFAIDSITQKI